MSISLDRFKRVFYREFKDVRHKLFLKHVPEKKIVFILGCQRSGTTILSEVIEKDYRTKVYKETHSKLSKQDPSGLRLDPLPVLKKEIYGNNTETIILKPLVESQYTNRLLNDFPDSKGIWVLRHFKDVVSSDLKKFGANNGTANLRKILEGDTWRSEQMSASTLALIKKYYKEDMSQNDAAALYWYTRNILFFDQGLEGNGKIVICKYEDLVSKPKEAMKKLYEHIDLEYPKKDITARVFSSSIKKGKDTVLHPDIESLCEDLYGKLVSCYENPTG